MLDLLLALIAIVSATESILQLRQLDRLLQEFHHYSSRVLEVPAGFFRAIFDQESLDSHQRILRTQVLVTSTVLMLHAICLASIVLITL